MIDANLVTAHVQCMPHAPEELISPHTLSEMRPEKIGNRMRLLREALGLKPAEIADSLGIERTYWSRFENGKRPITNATAALLLERYGVTLEFLILGIWTNLPLSLADRMRAAEAKRTQNN